MENILSMLPTNFHSFGEAVLEENVCAEIDQSETRITCSCHVCKRIGIKLAIYIEDLIASYQASVHWGRQVQRRRFLEIDQSKTGIVCVGHVC